MSKVTNEYLKDIKPNIFDTNPGGIRKQPHFFNSFEEIGWPNPTAADELKQDEEYEKEFLKQSKHSKGVKKQRTKTKKKTPKGPNSKGPAIDNVDDLLDELDKPVHLSKEEEDSLLYPRYKY